MKKILSSKTERQPEVYKTILGIDSSTTGVAWTVVRDGVPMDSGKIKLDKVKGIDQKILTIAEELPAILAWQKPDHIFIEMPIFVMNPATARSLSFIVGAIMTTALPDGFEITLVDIASWKSFIGYTNLNAKFQAEAKRILGKTEGGKLLDRLRKSQTQRIIKHYFPTFEVGDNDISDSCAISLYGWNQLASQLIFEKNKEIAFDQVELAQLGLNI